MLAGIVDTPVNLCITCEHGRNRGAGLGRQTDPATDLYSTACAVENLWIAARAESLGVGWVSILDLDRLREVLNIPPSHTPVAYLCVGFTDEFPAEPELQTAGWLPRLPLADVLRYETWEGTTG